MHPYIAEKLAEARVEEQLAHAKRARHAQVARQARVARRRNQRRGRPAARRAFWVRGRFARTSQA